MMMLKQVPDCSLTLVCPVLTPAAAMNAALEAEAKFHEEGPRVKKAAAAIAKATSKAVKLAAVKIETLNMKAKEVQIQAAAMQLGASGMVARKAIQAAEKQVHLFGTVSARVFGGALDAASV